MSPCSTASWTAQPGSWTCVQSGYRQLPKYGRKLAISPVEVSLGHRNHGERPHAGRVRHERLVTKVVQPGPNGRVAALSGGGRHFGNVTIGFRVKDVEQAGFADARGARHGGYLAGKHLPQLTHAFACTRADVMDRKRSFVVGEERAGVRRARFIEIDLADDDPDRYFLQFGKDNETVEHPQVGNRLADTRKRTAPGRGWRGSPAPHRGYGGRCVRVSWFAARPPQ